MYVTGLGSIAWLKQFYSDPLVNVATALASLGCITVLIKEGSVQAGEFSDDKVVQVLLMVLMGIIVATAVNSLILPVTARQQLKNDVEKNTDLLGELLISITRAFLSGREDDLQDEYFANLQKEHQQSLQKMTKDLGEAKNEHLVLGSERLYEVANRLVDCLDGLAQDLGGLRSAALAQFALVNSTSENDSKEHGNPLSSPTDRRPAWYNAATGAGERGKTASILDVITEAPDETDSANGRIHGNIRPPPAAIPSAISSGLSTPERRDSNGSVVSTLKGPDDMFFTFITQLGPPTKSLVFTLKQILDELPFKESADLSSYNRWLGPGAEVAINETFHSSLRDAVDLYRTSRKDSLNTLYASRALSAAFMPPQSSGGRKGGGAFSGQRRPSIDNTISSPQQPLSQKTMVDKPPEDVLADIEEVSACCGHFSFSLLDFAEDVLTYLSVLDELKDALEAPKATWKWLMFWRNESLPWNKQRAKFKPAADFEHGVEHGASHDIPEPVQKADAFGDPEKARQARPWTWWIYRKLRYFRRDDIKFAVKVCTSTITTGACLFGAGLG